jgi:hypothetical protein
LENVTDQAFVLRDIAGFADGFIEKQPNEADAQPVETGSDAPEHQHGRQLPAAQPYERQ